MKLFKFACVAVAALSIATACEASKPNPEETLKVFLAAAREFKFKEASQHIDPKSQAEFMELAAFYDQIPDSVKNSLPKIPEPTIETVKIEDTLATLVAKTVISEEDAQKMGGTPETQVDTFKLKYLDKSWKIMMR